MKRVKQMQLVQASVDQQERNLSVQLAQLQQQLESRQHKLHELVSYRDDYMQGLAQRASIGMGARDLLDYQVFMTRLGKAIEQQSQLVTTAQSDYEIQRMQWQQVAKREKMLDKLVDGWQRQASHAAHQREQHDQDQHAVMSRRHGSKSGRQV